MAEKTIPTKPSADLRERLWRARRLIDECYDRPLDLSEISREACLSRYHFLRSFRDTFETTPPQYLIKKRIEKPSGCCAPAA
jgi:AraC-like DNA-binding protein